MDVRVRVGVNIDGELSAMHEISLDIAPPRIIFSNSSFTVIHRRLTNTARDFGPIEIKRTRDLAA